MLQNNSEIIIFVTLLVFITSQSERALAAGTSCNQGSSTLSSQAFEISKNLQLQNLTATCDALLKPNLNFLIDPKDLSPNHDKAYKRLLDGDQEEIARLVLMGGAWAGGMLPSEKSREATYDLMTNFDLLGLKDKAAVEEYLNNPQGVVLKEKRVSKSNISCAPNCGEDVNGGYPIGLKLNVESDLKTIHNPLVRIGLCAEITPFKSIDCGNGLLKIVDRFQVNQVSMPGVYKEVLSNKKYEKGLRLAAQLIMKKVGHKGINPGHLFDDIKSSFIKSGLTSKEADEYTWNTIGVISTAGPNLVERVSRFNGEKYSDISKVAISAIANAMPVLDRRTYLSGHPYSLPQEITTTCDSGKPYHFWMTAYFSRQLVGEGHSPEAAAAAAYIAAKGYQMKAEHESRNPSEVFEKNALSDTATGIRVDLSYNGGGAWFGAKYKDSGPTRTNLDGAIKKSISSAENIPPLSTSVSSTLWDKLYGTEVYIKWSKIIKPSINFNYFK